MLAVHVASIALTTICRLAFHKATLGGQSHLIISQPKHLKTVAMCTNRNSFRQTILFTILTNNQVLKKGC